MHGLVDILQEVMWGKTMIRLRQIEVNIKNDSVDNVLKKCASKLNVKAEEIQEYKIIKKSLDARKKPELFFSYEIDVKVKNEEKILQLKKGNTIFKSLSQEYIFPKKGQEKLNFRPIVVGFGPAGMFCAYMLASLGYKPLIIERGEEIEKRVKSVKEFWEKNTLDVNSNVQFGEGGAGTFSDGKLNTLVKDKKNIQKKIFEIFVENGAPQEILYDYKPHIGTDLLQTVVKNIRKKIISMGGEFHFNTCLTNILYENNQIKAIEVNHKEIIKTEVVVLAIGHSARDTFEILLKNKIEMQAKPFAVGIRISHLQSKINEAQYGSKSIPELSNASYKLTYKASNNRGVYTFCMCPGGYVINASSEEKSLAINGMSNYKRESENANSAIIVTVSPDDFGYHPLDGIQFQRDLEQKAYHYGNGFIPVQLYKDFKKNQISTCFGSIKPIFKGNYHFANLNQVLPEYITYALKEAIEYFGTKINCYNEEDAILAGVESRTSSPVKIIRDENLESNIKGLYPCGEGAGYAGGITSAAIDGVKVFEKIVEKYQY